MTDKTVSETIKLALEYSGDSALEYFASMSCDMRPYFDDDNEFNQAFWMLGCQVLFNNAFTKEWFSELIQTSDLPYNVWSVIAILDDMVYDETFYTATQNIKRIHEGHELNREINIK